MSRFSLMLLESSLHFPRLLRHVLPMENLRKLPLPEDASGVWNRPSTNWTESFRPHPATPAVRLRIPLTSKYLRELPDIPNRWKFYTIRQKLRQRSASGRALEVVGRRRGWMMEDRGWQSFPSSILYPLSSPDRHNHQL